MKIENVGRLKSKLLALVGKFGQEQASVTVGFTQKYALYVHEVQANHVVGQWKYLEAPARSLKYGIARNVEKALTRGVPMEQALMLGGLLLQREAQKLTPVDTSALKASAFTCPTDRVEAVSQAKYAESESIRIAETSARNKK